MPPSHVLTYTDKYMCLVPIYADELKHTYFYLTEQHAPEKEKGILVKFRCNTGIILTTEISILHRKCISASFIISVSTIQTALSN